MKHGYSKACSAGIPDGYACYLRPFIWRPRRRFGAPPQAALIWARDRVYSLALLPFTAHWTGVEKGVGIDHRPLGQVGPDDAACALRRNLDIGGPDLPLAVEHLVGQLGG